MRNATPRSLLVLAMSAGIAAMGPGCTNACQSLCKEIADFAKTECGLTFDEGEIDTCIADHASSELDEGEAAVCRDGKGRVAEEWDCEELAAYFEDAGTDGGTGTTTP